MAKKRIYACWLLLLAVLYTGCAAMAVTPAQARYVNTAQWQTTVQEAPEAVSIDYFTGSEEPPRVVLLGEMPQSGPYEIKIQMKTTADAQGKLNWIVDEEDYIHVTMSVGEHTLEQGTEIYLTAGEAPTELVMTLKAAPEAFTEPRDAMTVTIRVTWGKSMTGTFQVQLPAVEPVAQTEEDPGEDALALNDSGKLHLQEPLRENQDQLALTGEITREPSEPADETTAPTEDTTPTDDTTPTEDTTPTGDTTPTEDTTPTGDTTPTEDPMPTEDTTPTEDPMPTEDTTPTEDPEPTGEPEDEPDPEDPEEEPEDPEEEPEDPEEDPEEEPRDPVDVTLDTPESFTGGEQLPLKIQVPEGATMMQLGLGIQSDTTDQEGNPQMTLGQFPKNMCYSIDNGESYYLLYQPGFIVLAPGAGDQVTVLLDWALVELEEESLMLAVECYQDQTLVGTGSTQVKARAHMTVDLTSRILTRDRGIRIRIPDPWQEYELEITLEFLTCAYGQDGKPGDMIYAKVDPEAGGLTIRTEEETGDLLLELGQTLPPAGTYRITLRWIHEEVCIIQTAETFFIQYISYTDTVQTGGAE